MLGTSWPVNVFSWLGGNGRAAIQIFQTGQKAVCQYHVLCAKTVAILSLWDRVGSGEKLPKPYARPWPLAPRGASLVSSTMTESRPYANATAHEDDLIMPWSEVPSGFGPTPRALFRDIQNWTARGAR